MGIGCVRKLVASDTMHSSLALKTALWHKGEPPNKCLYPTLSSSKLSLSFSCMWASSEAMEGNWGAVVILQVLCCGQPGKFWPGFPGTKSASFWVEKLRIFKHASDAFQAFIANKPRTFSGQHQKFAGAEHSPNVDESWITSKSKDIMTHQYKMLMQMSNYFECAGSTAALGPSC